MHDGTFLGLQGVHRAQIVGFGPDSRPRVLIPALGETTLLARSLVLVPAEAVGRQAAVVMMEEEPLVLGLIQPLVPEVEADGEKLVLEARKEVTLRCGKASIHLTADGRVTIRGTQVLSRSDGPNRVQGASVQLN
ncbi:MAG: hypothetical protein U1E69_13565 [Tabrizicola sp.]|uniref:hypothetical protein n=1 Tax=Tabrizicola sp. TaxID=2005166 RepID=UPI002ABCE2B1|nr:hypothetical protein [Tabrizicola sp.]MDZ4087816.1 hypothetical protein [Tabrizicola sp.]